MCRREPSGQEADDVVRAAQSAQNLKDAVSTLKSAGTRRGSTSGSTQSENHGV